ncbi:MAG: Rrf2 family transcriptional regulator [Candidatus Eisenbacteria bacterium]
MSSPIKISEAASLALHAAAILAGTDGGRASAEAIADALGVSKAHLVKVLQRLTKAGLVRSSRGPGGGYGLARPPREISVREVYETVEGPIDVAVCAMEVPTCGWASCVLGDLFRRMGKELRDELDGTTIADFSASVGKSIGV